MPVNSEKKRRVCLVTGGARGFGQAISRRLAELGHDVAVMDVVSAAATAELVRQTGSRFLSIEADISVRQNVGEAALEISGTLGPVNILVAKAAICPIAPLLQTSWESWRSTMDVNVDGFLASDQAEFITGQTILAEGGLQFL